MILAALAACAEPVRDGRAPPVDDTGPAVPVAPADPLDVGFVTWSASFGWDGGPVAVGTPYGTVEPRIVITLADESWGDVGYDAAHADLYCEIELPLLDPAAWVDDDDRLWLALDAGEAPARTTCGEPERPIARSPWGPDPAAALSAMAWGVAVGELSPAAADYVGYAFPAADQPYLFGGRVLGGDLRTDDDVYGRAWALDAAGALAADGSGAATTLRADDLFAGGELARGWYRLEAIYLYPVSAASR